MKTGVTFDNKTVIVKYQNRKHYNVLTSKYVNLTKILALGIDNFVVIDHKTKLDITFETIISALSTHFYNNPKEFARVKPNIVKTLNLDVVQGE